MKLKERMIRIAALTVAAVSVVIFTVGSKDLLADDETPSEGATVVIQTDDEDASEDDSELVDVSNSVADKDSSDEGSDVNEQDKDKTPDQPDNKETETTVTPTVDPTVTPEITQEPEKNPEETDTKDEDKVPADSDIRKFVERLYSTCLDRGSDVDGIDYWSKVLYDHERTGASVAVDFVFSEEYLSKNASDEEFLKMLYYAFFDREPDKEGMDYWLFQMKNSGCTRRKIFECFVNSQEFYDICDNFGIVRGYYESDDPEDLKPENALFTKEEFDIFNFVERLYGTCLNRGSDLDGIRYWTRQLSSKARSGAQVSYEFVFSEEYLGKNTSDEEFLKMLYYAFFDREPDDDGFKYWLDTLQNTLYTRKYIFQCFVNSDENKEICDKYGIDRGAYFSDDPCDQYPEIAKFVERLYNNVLGRTSEKDGIDYWTLNLGTFEMTPKEVANRFFDSQEFKDKNTTDEEYVDVLYKTCMGRDPEADGKTFWLDGLKDKTYTRTDVLNFFISCEEFDTIMKATGIVEKPIVTVARQEVGQEGGKPYLEWYGYKYRIEWCAVFVSWCANQCGYIDSGVVPKYKWCLDAKDWFIKKGRWVSDNMYRPKSGDIIFFDWNGNGVIDHTGIVVGTDATGRIHTIEGNKKDAVRNDRVIYVGDPDICGYGIPAY